MIIFGNLSYQYQKNKSNEFIIKSLALDIAKALNQYKPSIGAAIGKDVLARGFVSNFKSNGISNANLFQKNAPSHFFSDFSDNIEYAAKLSLSDVPDFEKKIAREDYVIITSSLDIDVICAIKEISLKYGKHTSYFENEEKKLPPKFYKYLDLILSTILDFNDKRLNQIIKMDTQKIIISKGVSQILYKDRKQCLLVDKYSAFKENENLDSVIRFFAKFLSNTIQKLSLHDSLALAQAASALENADDTNCQMLYNTEILRITNN